MMALSMLANSLKCPVKLMNARLEQFHDVTMTCVFVTFFLNDLLFTEFLVSKEMELTFNTSLI